MEDFYVLYRMRDNVKKLIIEHIEAKDKYHARAVFERKHGYEENQMFSYHEYLYEDIMDFNEYDFYQKVEYTKQIQKRNKTTWIKKLNELIENNKTFKIKQKDYQALYHIAEEVMGSKIIYLKSTNINKTQYEISLKEEWYNL